MTDQDAIKTDVEAFLDVPEIIEIPVIERNIIKKILIRLKILKPSKLTYSLRMIKVANREKIALRVSGFPDGLYSEKSVVARVMELSRLHTNDLIYCAAVALQNDEREPSKLLLESLRWVDDEILYNILEKSFAFMAMANFLNSIVLISGIESMASQKKKD